MAVSPRRIKAQQRALKAQANAAPPTSSKAFLTGDSIQNLNARVGIGAQNQTNGTTYSIDYISRNRLQLEGVYRSSWIGGAAVDCVAEDMTRAGIEITADELKPDQIEDIHGAFERLNIWGELCDNIKWARLYGGSIAVLLIDGQDMQTPLRLETVQKGQFRGLLVLDRWQIQPSLTNLVKEIGPDLGKPKFYTVLADGAALMGRQVHYSRCIRMEGLTLPYWQRIAENGWGQSVIERLWDRLIAFDSTTQGAAQLVYKAHLRTYKVENLRDIINAGGKVLEGFVKQMEMIRVWQTNEGLTLMDAKDEFETHQYTFSGLDNVLLQFGQQLSGAVNIPLVRLFGQSPAGLNSTGESDIRNYYDQVAKDQDRQLRPGLFKVLNLVVRSELGIEQPRGLQFSFVPLWQLSDLEKATVGQQKTAAIIDAYTEGVIDRATALKELRKLSHVCGLWSHITDELIEEAENDPPAPRENDEPDNGQGKPQAA